MIWAKGVVLVPHDVIPNSGTAFKYLGKARPHRGHQLLPCIRGSLVRQPKLGLVCDCAADVLEGPAAKKVKENTSIPLSRFGPLGRTRRECLYLFSSPSISIVTPMMKRGTSPLCAAEDARSVDKALALPEMHLLMV